MGLPFIDFHGRVDELAQTDHGILLVTTPSAFGQDMYVIAKQFLADVSVPRSKEAIYERPHRT